MDNNKYVDEIFDEIKKEVEVEDAVNSLKPLKASEINKISFDKQKFWVVKNLIPAEGTMFLTGEAGSYKSWLALHIAIAVYNGDPVFGQYVTNKGNVLYIDEENPMYLVQKRLRMYGAENSDLLFMIRTGFRIDNNWHMERLAEIIKENDIKLVVFDSFVRVHEKEENSSREMAYLNRQVIKYILNIGASVLYLHHHGKNNIYRGSSDLRANPDSVFSIERLAETGRVALTHEKARHNEYMKKINLALFFNDTTATVTFLGLEEGPLAEFHQAANERKLLDYLSQQTDYVDIIQMVNDLELSDSSIRRAIESLRKQEKLLVQTGPSNKKFYKLKVEN